MNGRELNKNIFKYNMLFYYQSTIIYFVVFIIYAVIRGEFVEDSYTLITKDPIIYFFAMIVFISLISLLYNLYVKRHLEISDEGISFIDRFKTKTFTFDQMTYIKISKRVRRKRNRPFRLIRIKLTNRRRSLIIRPYDYENEEELLHKFNELKLRVENK